MSGNPGSAIAGETCPINPYCWPQETSERVMVTAFLSPRRQGVREPSQAFWHALSTLAPPGLGPQCLSSSSHTPHIHKHTVHTIQTHTAHTSIHSTILPMYKHKYTTHHIHIHTRYTQSNTLHMYLTHYTNTPHTLYIHPMHIHTYTQTPKYT